MGGKSVSILPQIFEPPLSEIWDYLGPMADFDLGQSVFYRGCTMLVLWSSGGSISAPDLV